MPRAYFFAGTAALALLPFLLSPTGSVLHNLVLAAVYAGMALGLNVIVGFAGLLDLGYVAFFALGAYSAGYLASGFREVHLSWLLVLPVAAAGCALAGALIGVPALRVRGDYVALVTLAFGEIIGILVGDGDQIHLGDRTLTAGARGITPIDVVDLPLLPAFTRSDLRPWYWFALALLLAILVANTRLRRSRLGRAWVAVREDEEVAASLGIPVARTKLAAYSIGAAFGGVCGAFLSSYLNIIAADQFELSFSLFVLGMVVIGGLGSVGGVILAAAALSAFNSYLLPDVLSGIPSRLGLDFELAAVSGGIYGLMLVLAVLFRPNAVGR